MAKDKITEHGLLYDFINYKALIEEQSSNRTFLGSPKKDNEKINKNYKIKPKVKKLTYKKIIK